MAHADRLKPFVFLRQLKATLDRRNLSHAIGSIRCPLTVIAGQDDRIVSAQSIMRFSEYLPRATVHFLPECGHFVPLEQPQQVNELLFRPE